MTIFVFLLSLFSLPPTFAQETAPLETQKLASRFYSPMVTCPEKIWPDYSWQNLNVLFVYPNQDKSWVWSASAQSFTALANSKLSPSTLSGFYDFIELEGKRTLSLNMNQQNELFDFFRLGVHEFFHFHGQNEWVHEASGRGTDYPVKPEPRIFRRMIFDHLKSYFLNPNQTNLQKARYWFDRWSQEFPNEVKVATDGYEGSAEYTEMMAVALDALGCSATPEQLRRHIANQLQSNFGFSFTGQILDLSSEGYELGALAFFILKFSQQSEKEWSERVSRGESPLKILLEKVEPQQEESPIAVKDVFENSAARVNKEMGQIVDADLAAWSDRNYIRVEVPFEWLESNLSPQFFLRSTELNLFLLALARDHNFQSPRPGISLNLKKGAVLFRNVPGHCGEANNYILIESKLLTKREDVFHIVAPLAAGILDHTENLDQNQFRYLCQK